MGRSARLFVCLFGRYRASDIGRTLCAIATAADAAAAADTKRTPSRLRPVSADTPAPATDFLRAADGPVSRGRNNFLDFVQLAPTYCT